MEYRWRRLRDGRLSRRRRGVTFQIQRYFVDGREILYLVTFCLPRFLDLTFDEKFVTIFHELFHIGPSFNGVPACKCRQCRTLAQE